MSDQNAEYVWFLFDGNDEPIAGPFDKAEAERHLKMALLGEDDDCYIDQDTQIDRSGP